LDDIRNFTESETEGTKVEVLEEGKRTVSVNGETFEDALWRKVKWTTEARGPNPRVERIVELWEDDKAPHVMARVLKRTQEWGAKVEGDQVPVEGLMVVERVAYGRAGDPVPEISEDGGDAPVRDHSSSWLLPPPELLLFREWIFAPRRRISSALRTVVRTVTKADDPIPAPYHAIREGRDEGYRASDG